MASSANKSPPPPAASSSSSSFSDLVRHIRSRQSMDTLSSEMLTDDHLWELRATFRVFDRDQSGVLDARELKQALRALGYDPSREEVTQFIADLDKDGSGDVSLDEFVALMCQKVSARSAEKEMRAAFQLLQGSEGNAVLTTQQLRRAAREAGIDDVTDEELDAAVEHADRHLQGGITEDAFHEAVRKATLFHG